jgi:23S rRNA pseudouridine1911/1915/1917 synthase
LKIEITIPEDMAGLRLDQALVALLSQFSRMRLKKWIEDKNVTVDMQYWRPRDKVHGGENIIVDVTLEEQVDDKPQAIPLDIIYEDDDLIVINKPAGLVVHPAVGNRAGTLLNALLYHTPELAKLPRAGIIHRLDKDTSGLLVIAKTLTAHTSLVKQLGQREFLREYEAVILGELTGGGTIEEPIGRHPKLRTHMAVVTNGKPAITHYRILKRLKNFTLITVKLETGRTHQIRVHMAYIHHPIIGDQTYGGRMKLPKDASVKLITTLRNFKRQALHAKKLGLTHPITNKWLEWQIQPPEDMQNLIEELETVGLGA